MGDLIATGIRYEQGKLSILDQQKLPKEETWISCDSLEATVSAIQKLKVRGAPAIGITSALFLLSQLEKNESPESLLSDSAALRASRPTAVNLMNYLDRLNPIISSKDNEWKEKLSHEVQQIFHEDVELCENIATHGLTVLSDNALPDNPQILTHCNTGSVATAGRGTAIGIFTKAHEEGLNPHIWVDETRPLLQGGRLTSWELGKAGVDYTLICDNMAGMVMAQGKVNCVIVGADRIAMNGDFANKIGTYSLAVLASHHNVPFYVAAPTTTIDRDCKNGSEIPIEERDEREVHGFSGEFGSLHWTPDNAPVYNPAFDLTPAELISGWILDSGVYREPSW